MSKAFKKLTGLLLAMLMVVTLIPVMGGKADAETVAFSLSVNGQPTDKSVTREWLENNSSEAQIFPFAGGQGKDWQYHIAKGPNFEDVLAYLTGAETLADLKDVAINWNKGGSQEGKFDLPVTDLQVAKACFKLIDQKGEDITGPFDDSITSITSAEAVALDGAGEVDPIVAVKEKAFSSYEAAVNAKGTWEEGANTNISPYVGGILTKETFLKQDGKVQMGVVNFTGKFAMKNCPEINLKIKIPAMATSVLTFTNTTPKQADFSYALTETEKQLLFKTVTWTSSDTAVATVDKSGKVAPNGLGTCTVTATAKHKEWDKVNKKWIEGTTEIGRCTVTVDKSAFTPAKPANFKVKNVKKRSAKLTWKRTADANGYIIYRSTKKNKGFKKVKTIKNGKTTKFVNKKLKKRKTYYYKIKAYRTVQGKTLYSPLTVAKKVKIKK